MFCSAVLSETVPLVMSRTLITNLVDLLKLLPHQESQQDMAQYVLEKIQPRAVSYEEPLMKMCEFLSHLYQQQEAWSDAANTLARIDLESGMRVVDSGYKIGKYVKIARFYLEDGDVAAADTYIKKASSLLSSSAPNQHLTMFEYQACFAKVLDHKRKFSEAASKYYDLSKLLLETSTTDSMWLTQQETLDSSIKCAIMASAGPQRSRMLSTLYKDERSETSSLYSILEKVFLERLLLAKDVEAFSQTLEQHQLAMINDGQATTVLDMAVIQHNLEACSKLYTNITFSSLAKLLQIPKEKAQKIVATMIIEGRLPAEIDEIEDLVIFGPMESDRSNIDAGHGAKIAHTTASTGHKTTVEEALRLADQALALAKTKGFC